MGKSKLYKILEVEETSRRHCERRHKHRDWSVGIKMKCRNHEGKLWYPCNYMVFHDVEGGNIAFCGIDGKECDGRPLGKLVA